MACEAGLPDNINHVLCQGASHLDLQLIMILVFIYFTAGDEVGLDKEA
ncbi:MAG: hypothetical protein JRI54_06360 [Deltaproteobacteria bacterium]|nr:hypothetical protein [Deltaproteobacteria bacterium]